MAEARTLLERKLWEIADSLRGKIDVAELPLLALLLVTSKAMAGKKRWQKEKFPSWERALEDSTGMSLRRFLDLSQNALSGQLVSDDLLDRVSQDRSVFEATRSLAVLLEQRVAEDEMQTRADEILEFAREQGGLRSGEHMSPPSLRRLVGRLAALSSHSEIYDPACGTAGLLLQTAGEVDQAHHQSEINLYGQELDTRTAALARANLLLHGFDAAGIRSGDTLTQPGHTNGERLSTFDCIVTALPMGMRLSKGQQDVLSIDQYGRFSYADPGLSAEIAFLQHILASLKEQGTAVAVISPGFLFLTGRAGELKRALIESSCIRTVVALPLIFPGTSVRPALLILRRSAAKNSADDIQFVAADSLYTVEGRQRVLSDEGIEEIVAVVREREATPGFSAIVAIEDVLANDASLVPSIYLTEYDPGTLLGGKTEVVRLDDIARVERGAKVRIAKEPTGGPPVLRGSDLRQVSVDPEELAHADLEGEMPSLPRVQSADVLVQRIGTRPAAFLVSKDLSGTVLSDSVIRVRLADEHLDIAPFLVDFLNAEAGQTALSTCIRGTGAPFVHLNSLKNLRIPLPNRGIVGLVGGLREVEVDLLDRVARTRRIREQLFGARDKEKAALSLAALGAEQQVLAASLLRIDDLAFRIRNFYPFPLAYPYRMLDPITDPLERYTKQLTLAETLLAYLGSLGLALLAHARGTLGEGTHPLSIESLEKYWCGGISPGDWHCIGRETGRILRTMETNTLCTAFSSLWFKGSGTRESDFSGWAGRLVEVKNHFKHDRGPKTHPEYEEAVKQLQRIVDDCFERLSFLVRHPHYLTQAPEVDPLSKSVTMPVLNYSGDHPGFKQERHEQREALPNDALYVAASPEDWVSLFPLVTVQYCPTCGARGMFFIDRWDGQGKRVVLKSFERGHAMGSTNDVDQAAEKAVTVGEYFQRWLASAFETQRPG